MDPNTARVARRTILGAALAAALPTIGGDTVNFATDDLAGLLVQPRQEFAGLAEGLVKSFNQDTFESVINVGGADLPNLPIASGVEALTYRPGDVVLITKWRPRSSRGIATYRVGMGGRVIQPGSGAATKAVAFMQAQLARQVVDEMVAALLTSPAGVLLAQFVVGQSVTSADVAALQSTTSTSYGNLSTVGPTVSGVEISDAGKALVLVSGNLTAAGGDGANMSFTVSGATTIAAGSTGTLSLVTAGGSIAGSVTKAVPLTLNPGTHTFQAKYRSGGGGIAAFNQRVLTVIAY